jgi:hypothetical protein
MHSLVCPGRSKLFVIALFVGAGDHRAGFRFFPTRYSLPHVGHFSGDRLVRRSEFALRIISASVESIALARPLLDQIAVFALRTLHADEVLLHVLAFGISAARRELAETPVPDHHVAPALRAKLIERNIGNFLALIQPPRSLAIGISRASHELPEAPALQHHHPAAVFAIFFLRGLLHVGRIEVGQVDRIFFGELAGVRDSLCRTCCRRRTIRACPT